MPNDTAPPRPDTNTDAARDPGFPDAGVGPEDIHPLFRGAPATTSFRKLRKRLVRDTRASIDQFGMIEPGGSSIRKAIQHKVELL